MSNKNFIRTTDGHKVINSKSNYDKECKFKRNPKKKVINRNFICNTYIDFDY